MIAPRSLQQRIADVPAVPVAHAIGWLQRHDKEAITAKPGAEGRLWQVGELTMTAEQIIDRYRARVATIQQGAGG